jgi:2-aminoethylphosphonate transport system substrate-binding protein
MRACALLAVALVAASCGGAGARKQAGSTTTTPNPSTAATGATTDFCAGTTRGSQVVLYSTTGLDYWYGDVLTAFETSCGVQVVYQSDTSPQIVQDLEDESGAPDADIVVADAPDLTRADGDHLLETGGTPGSDAVPADRCGPHRDWCDVAENYASLVYNPKLVSDPPKTLADLLAPRFAGQLLLSDLALAEDGRTFIDLLDVTLGRAEALHYLAALEPSVRTHWVSTDTMSRLVASGKALVANGDLREQLNDIVQYKVLAIWFPAIGATPTTIEMPYGAALVHGGRNRANAVALLRFMWSKAGQAAVADAPGVPARPDVVPSDCRSRDLRTRLAGVRVIRPDWQKVAADERALEAAWSHLKRALYGVPPPAVGIPPLQPCS